MFNVHSLTNIIEKSSSFYFPDLLSIVIDFGYKMFLIWLCGLDVIKVVVVAFLSVFLFGDKISNQIVLWSVILSSLVAVWYTRMIDHLMVGVSVWHFGVCFTWGFKESGGAVS